MIISTYAFTEKGRQLENKIGKVLKDRDFRGEGIKVLTGRIKENVKEDFENCDSLIFIGALGIAVRLTAPYINNKLKDPNVIVIDENGQFVIPVLSGHFGGGNHLSKIIAEKISASCIITTASDNAGVFAVDEFAAENNLKIRNKDKIKIITKKLLEGETVSLSLSDDVIVSEDVNDGNNCILHLLMRPYVVGMGCRKNTPFEKLEKYFLDTLFDNNIDVNNVLAIATIDLKKDEEGLKKLCSKYDIRFVTYSAEELKEVKGEFDESAFVESVTGVSEVSARAAKLCGGKGRFIVKKEKNDGMTISVFEKLRRVNLQYE